MDITEFRLNVRGAVPSGVQGRLVFACGRRDKRHDRFSRWHDSRADLCVIDLEGGNRPLRGRILSATDEELGLGQPSGRYAAQPNHAVNIAGRQAWATNLHFGAPFGVDLDTGDFLGILQPLRTGPDAPQATSTAHFAFTPDRRYAFFQQGLLSEPRGRSRGVQTGDLSLVRYDTKTGACRVWRLLPPADDTDAVAHNFHSAFYFERRGKPYVGLLRTGARFNGIAPHRDAAEHAVHPMQESAVWVIRIAETANTLQAELLTALSDQDMRALSHLELDTRVKDGFILYANYKQADVGQETHGRNIYGEEPHEVWEHYSGMTVEAYAPGKVVRFDASGESPDRTELCLPYDHGRVGAGHTWLPINLELDASGTRLFASFAGFRPRLLPRHVAAGYPELAIPTESAGYAPPLLMRLDAKTLQPDRAAGPALSYAEPIAFTLLEGGGRQYVCTVSTELGIRIYDADDLSAVICEASASELAVWGDTHFRTEPAHVEFADA